MALLKKFQGDLQVDGNLTFDTTTRNITGSKLIGGTVPTSGLTLQTTSDVGTVGADMRFLTGDNGSIEAMTILNNGNVGIGTPDAGMPLSVIRSNSNYQLRLGTTDPNWAWDLGRISVDGNFQIRAIYNNVENSPAFIIKQTADGSAGNVGIGNTSPEQKLDISGDGAQQQE